jgi:uncharacterized membrane protein
MRYLIALLALAGVVVSTMALRIHYSTDTQPCSINEKWDCGIVNHSPFAEVAHVPVAAIGIAGYLVLAGLSLARRRWLVLAAAVMGLGFSLYLTHIEKHVLQEWCLYCVTSLGIISAITMLSLGWGGGWGRGAGGLPSAGKLNQYPCSEKTYALDVPVGNPADNAG